MRVSHFWFGLVSATLVVDASGHYTQHRIGEFPEIDDASGNPLRFGANAQFFPAPGIPTYDNGVIKLDDLTTQTTLGYIFGGLFANAPNTQGVPGAVSGASNEIFTVVYTPVPEPAAWVLLLPGLLIASMWACAQRRATCRSVG